MGVKMKKIVCTLFLFQLNGGYALTIHDNFDYCNTDTWWLSLRGNWSNIARIRLQSDQVNIQVTPIVQCFQNKNSQHHIESRYTEIFMEEIEK
jgi:hypothetical protein